MAQTLQDPAPIRQAIENWLKSQLQGLPGESRYEIGTIGAGTQLASCGNLEISRPAGAPAWGRGHVIVRCVDSPGWRINVPINIRVKTEYLVAARPIAQGQAISPEDLAIQSGDLSELPARIVLDGNLALGKTAAVPIQAGTPLRSEMLRAAIVIRQGQTVKVISRGNGFEVANEGRALNNAAEGQLAQVRMTGGQVISGVAKAGGNVVVGF